MELGERRARDLGKSREEEKGRDGMVIGDGGRVWMEGKLGRKEGIRMEGVVENGERIGMKRGMLSREGKLMEVGLESEEEGCMD